MAVITSKQAREQRALEVENAIVTGLIEGLEPPPEALAVFEQYVNGELTLEQMGQEIEEQVDLEYGPLRLPGD